MHETILPFLQQRPPSVSVFQFALSHLFAFSFLPALIFGFLIRRVVVSAPGSRFRLDCSRRSSLLQIRNIPNNNLSKSLRSGVSRILWWRLRNS